jgi:transcriptional regulator GlxA family with amidase domain
MHHMAIVALDGLVLFDLATPSDLFGSIRLASGDPAYRVRICGMRSEVDAGTFRLRTKYRLNELADADTVVLPGLWDYGAPVPEPLLRAVRAAAARGARIASICSGAFMLAAAGLLDGRKATTHWAAAEELARRYPKVHVDPHVLYVDEGQVLTSAGAAAALDLCLHIVRRDYGNAIAAQVARATVMPLERDGGQSQFIVHAPPSSDDASLSRVMRWLDQSLHHELTLPQIAKQAAMSVRSLNRHFKAQTGITPLQWLIKARLRRAQVLLETTSQSVEQIATEVGFGSVNVLREHFRRVVGVGPRAYRRSFQERPSAAAALTINRRSLAASSLLGAHRAGL